MTGKIFLSYRREDTAGFALALFGRLEQSFPAESLFMDVEGGIKAGQDFVRVLEEQVRACDAMLVLIGPNWLTVRDGNGQQRLENSEDFVRVEVASALKFDKRVIPVLVQKTEMPRADALPMPLKALARRNAVGLTNERFNADAQGLIKALEGALAEEDAARRQRTTRAPYAVVDIGSASVRLVIYDQLGRAPMPRFDEESLCRLGDGLARTGVIAADSFRRTVEAVRRFRAIADVMGVTDIDVIGTGAIRDASNGPALAAAIVAKCGLEVRVLSGAEEARFAALGVISGFFRPAGLVGDMKGGSLELAEALDDHVGERWASLPLGALAVASMLAEGLPEAKRRVDALLHKGLPPVLGRPVLYAVGGGWRSIAKVHLETTGAPVGVVHGYTLTMENARHFAKSLLGLSPERLASMPGVAADRAQALPAAALVLDRVLKRLGPERVVFSALGLREGFLYSRLSKSEQHLDPLVEGAQLTGLPQARVAEFAPALVDWTARIFPGETPAEARLRVAVCALSDIAWRDHPDVRAQESFRRLLQFPFVGVDHAERTFIAVAIHIRYAGRPDAPWVKPASNLLSPVTRRRAQILGLAILLAYQFSGGIPAALNASRLRIDSDTVRFEVGKAVHAPDSDVVSDHLMLFAKAVGLRRSEVVEVDKGP
jgi:exopolyphosphatase / guanosine-5'-triphosphate,3'-diphosphate pyrophosphatase